MKKYVIFHYLRSNVEFSTLQYLLRRIKRYCAKQRYRADFLRFLWRDNFAPGVFHQFLTQTSPRNEPTIGWWKLILSDDLL